MNYTIITIIVLLCYFFMPLLDDVPNLDANTGVLGIYTMLCLTAVMLIWFGFVAMGEKSIKVKGGGGAIRNISLKILNATKLILDCR